MPKTEVKKVKPFPFPITIKIGTHVISAQVVRMNKVGLMVETNSALVSVGDKVEAEFKLPVLNFPVVCTGLVVKLFNQITGSGGGMRIAEIHYKLIPPDAIGKIVEYLTAAGAKA